MVPNHPGLPLMVDGHPRLPPSLVLDHAKSQHVLGCWVDVLQQCSKPTLLDVLHLRVNGQDIDEIAMTITTYADVTML